MTTTDWIAVAAIVVASIAAAIAFAGYRHSVEVERRLMKDERIQFGPVHQLALSSPDHGRAMLTVHLVNLGRRKATVTKVEAMDQLGRVDVEWSTSIDAFGNLVESKGLVLVDPEISLHVRRPDGAAFEEGSKLFVTHSQADTPAELTFDGITGWAKSLGTPG